MSGSLLELINHKSIKKTLKTLTCLDKDAWEAQIWALSRKSKIFIQKTESENPKGEQLSLKGTPKKKTKLQAYAAV